jgi:hypothetical protein
VLEAAQDGHDLLGAEIGIEQIEWDNSTEGAIRLLEPPPGMFARPQRVFGDRRHTSETEQAIRLVGSETPLLLSTRQCSGRHPDHPRHRDQGNVVARPNARQ